MKFIHGVPIWLHVIIAAVTLLVDLIKIKVRLDSVNILGS